MSDMTSNRDLPSLAGAHWLVAPETRAVLAAIEDGGGCARVVGGAVRNALMGLAVKDIDIATTLQPEVVMACAAGHGLTVIPTGLSHGTVTVIAGHTPFEVTTLRRDVATDGRRAKVAFTDDWTADASRRDFTLNALYCDADGTVHDFVGGYADLKERRVRFIGTPRDRIREDYLRILRFYRFCAEYAAGQLDPAGHAACGELQEGLSRISAERLRSELMRLLVAVDAVPALRAMEGNGVLARLVLLPRDITSLARLQQIETALGTDPDPLRRLAALTPMRPGEAGLLRDHLRLSSTEYDRLCAIALADPGACCDAPEADARAALYRQGARAFQDVVMISWARDGRDPHDPLCAERFNLARTWHPPELPVRGADVLALGVAPGPGVGQVLARFEEWWISAGFPTDPDVLSRQLQAFAKVNET